MQKTCIVLFSLLMLTLSNDVFVGPEGGTASNPQQLCYILNKNDRLIVELNQVSSSGYSWDLLEEPQYLQVTKQVQRNSEDNLLGSGEKVTFTIQYKEDSDEQEVLTLVYLRPWLKKFYLEGGVEAYMREDDGYEPKVIELHIGSASYDGHFSQLFFEF